ncbi:MAG: phosphomannomutase/phosphoglucomutase [Gammaproteobacteria bacterium]|jgi:phosphomannomutase/phosphoglucomutase
MVDGPVSNRRFSRRQIRSTMMIGAGVIVALVIVIGGWYLYGISNKTAAVESQQQLEEFTQLQAQKMAAPFVMLGDQLAALAKDPTVVALFGEGDEKEFADAASSRLGQFDSALKLRFILPGKYAVDKESSPPLGYGSLDLLKRAEDLSAEIGAEVYLHGSPDEHIVILKRVKDVEAELIGFLHLSVSVDLFASAMAQLDVKDAYLELQQVSGGKTQILGKQGDAAMKVGVPTIIPVEGTRWTAALWMSGGVPSEDSSGSGMLIIVLLVVILFGAGIVVVLLLRRSKGDSDSRSSEVVYAGAVKAIMDGVHPGMEKMVPNLPVSAGQTQAVTPVSQGELGDDITMIIRAEDIKAAASETEVFDLTQAETPAEPGLSGNEDVTPLAQETPPPSSAQSGAPAGIFRAYDIRGIVGEQLNAEIVTRIGQAIGSEAGVRGQSTIAVGRDGRISSPELGDALIQGLRDSGRDVIDVGVVPTPVLYFAAHFLEVNSGVMLTGSHNGPEYNGLKIVLDGETLSEDGIQNIYTRIQENNFESGQGNLQSSEIIADYIRRISEDIPVALGGAYKIVVDCGNGVAGAVAPQLLRALGHDVVELYCDIDGNFPNHHPDPSQPENMQPLIEKLKEEQADLGFAFDGDGDRLGVVDDLGNIIWPDRQLMLLAKDVLSRNPGAPIIFDVKCSRYLKGIIESNGGKPLMWKTGHSLIKGKMKEVNAPLAGEMSGHIFFKERWYGFDDAIYTAARLLEVLMKAKVKPSETFAEMPEGVGTPELRIDLPETAHQSFMADLQEKIKFDGAEVIDIDGYRVEFADGWGLIRPSNTSPCLVLRFEAESKDALERIQSEFRTVLLSINSDLLLPF